MSAQPPKAVIALLANVCHVVQSVVSSPPESTHPRAEIFHFLTREDRLPRIGDERAPWTYCGRMLPYVIALHGHPLFGKSLYNKLKSELIATLASTGLSERGIGHCPDRWGYHLRTLAAGELHTLTHCP